VISNYCPSKSDKQGWLTRCPPWSFTNLQYHSLLTMISYYAIVFSFALMFTDSWFTQGVLALCIASAY